ncbi:MAG: hypothetical protein KF878_38135, partial [Planctomycetes bacterium]|nr:hypothetical protein [Planctomycetota bacterium]MCW8137755.1 hypothetical protein [Planctomycetota bacterium]
QGVRHLAQLLSSVDGGPLIVEARLRAGYARRTPSTCDFETYPEWVMFLVSASVLEGREVVDAARELTRRVRAALA